MFILQCVVEYCVCVFVWVCVGVLYPLRTFRQVGLSKPGCSTEGCVSTCVCELPWAPEYCHNAFSTSAPHPGSMGRQGRQRQEVLNECRC